MTDLSARITQYAESTRRLVSDAGELLLQANDQISDGTFDSAQWAKSMRQLANLALTAGLEVPQLMSVPCLPQSSGLELSDFIKVEPDNECQRLLSVSKPFVQDGAPSCVIPDQSIVFVPPILRVYGQWFRVAANWPDLRSGTYRGQVRLTRLKPAAPSADEFVDVIVDL